MARTSKWTLYVLHFMAGSKSHLDSTSPTGTKQHTQCLRWLIFQRRWIHTWRGNAWSCTSQPHSTSGCFFCTEMYFLPPAFNTSRTVDLKKPYDIQLSHPNNSWRVWNNIWETLCHPSRHTRLNKSPPHRHTIEQTYLLIKKGIKKKVSIEKWEHSVKVVQLCWGTIMIKD